MYSYEFIFHDTQHFQQEIFQCIVHFKVSVLKSEESKASVDVETGAEKSTKVRVTRYIHVCPFNEKLKVHSFSKSFNVFR